MIGGFHNDPQDHYVLKTVFQSIVRPVRGARALSIALIQLDSSKGVVWDLVLSSLAKGFIVAMSSWGLVANTPQRIICRAMRPTLDFFFCWRKADSR
jgi:hypothetical protein